MLYYDDWTIIIAIHQFGVSQSMIYTIWRDLAKSSFSIGSRQREIYIAYFNSRLLGVWKFGGQPQMSAGNFASAESLET